MNVTVIIPTYCEAANLPLLVPRVGDALANAGLEREILVVDDNSPDETQEVCSQLALSYPLRLLVRTGERGLASAVVYAVQQATGDVLVVMDADLSHPPEKVPDLVSALESDNLDFVIGSRYVKGGSVDEGWGLGRWLNSLVATLLVRPLVPVRDPMAGFFAVRRSLVERGERLNPVGFKIGLEIMVKCGCRRFAEVPIRFGNRQHGQSKLDWRERLRFLRHLFSLYAFVISRRIRGMVPRLPRAGLPRRLGRPTSRPRGYKP